MAYDPASPKIIALRAYFLALLCRSNNPVAQAYGDAELRAMVPLINATFGDPTNETPAPSARQP